MNPFKTLAKNLHGYQHPLLHIFMYQTLIWGLSFTFFTHSNTVAASALYVAMVSAVGAAGALTWGAVCLTVVVMMTIAVLFNKYELGRSASYGGYIMWLFVSMLYIQGGFWFPLIVSAVSNLYFWAWFYFLMNKLEREELKSLVKDYRTDWTD